MLTFSFASVFIAVLTSNLLIIFIYLIFQNKRFMLQTGYKVLGIFAALTALRLCFPFELPITTNIYFPGFLSMLFAELCFPRFPAAKPFLSMWHFCLFIWLAVSLFKAYSYLKAYFKLRNYLLVCGKEVTTNPKYQSLLDQICKEERKPNSFQIIELETIEVPMVCFFKKPCILMPQNLSLSEKELYFILRHEMMHFFHHDLLLKCFLEILCIIYWWNPFCKLLKKKSTVLLEMRVDHSLVKSNRKTRYEYLQCLLRITKLTPSDQFSDSALPFCSKTSSALTERFVMLQDSDIQEPKKHLSRLFLFCVIACVYLFSFFFIFEACYLPPSIADDPTIIIPTADNTYIIDNLDGTFSIYINKEYFETTDSLEHFNPDIPIYKKGESK